MSGKKDNNLKMRILASIMAGIMVLSVLAGILIYLI